MVIVSLPNVPVFFDVIERGDLYAVLRNRTSGDEFVVTERTFREFRTVTHPSIRKSRI
jgi:hypothetical protein